MGGKWEKRLCDRSMLTGISSSSSSSSLYSDAIFLSTRRTSSLVSAAVDGLMSWAAEGARLMWAVWIVSAICMGMSDEAAMASRSCDGRGTVTMRYQVRSNLGGGGMGSMSGLHFVACSELLGTTVYYVVDRWWA